MPVQFVSRTDETPAVPSQQRAADAAAASVGGEVGVLTVDDQASFRSAARAVIGATRGFRALAEVASAAEALVAVDAVAPQLVLMDVRMPGTDGIEATRRLLARRPETVVILVSVDTPELLPAECRSCGAAAVVRKQDLRPRLLAELWRAHGRRRLPR